MRSSRRIAASIRRRSPVASRSSSAPRSSARAAVRSALPAALPRAGSLIRREDVQPVRHRLVGEVRPRPSGFHERPGIALDPQDEEAPVGRIRQPSPDFAHGAREVGVGVIAAKVLEHRQLIGPGAAKQRFDQAIFGTEEEEQHPGARSDC